jgi:hypothetical protein
MVGVAIHTHHLSTTFNLIPPASKHSPPTRIPPSHTTPLQRPRHQRSRPRPSASPPRDAGPRRRTSAHPVQHSAQRCVSCTCACHPRGPRNVCVQRPRGVQLGDGLNHDGWCLQRARNTATRLTQDGRYTRGAVFGVSCLRCVTGWGWVGGGVGTFWGGSVARVVFV